VQQLYDWLYLLQIGTGHSTSFLRVEITWELLFLGATVVRWSSLFDFAAFYDLLHWFCYCFSHDKCNRTIKLTKGCPASDLKWCCNLNSSGLLVQVSLHLMFVWPAMVPRIRVADLSPRSSIAPPTFISFSRLYFSLTVCSPSLSLPPSPTSSLQATCRVSFSLVALFSSSGIHPPSTSHSSETTWLSLSDTSSLNN
jgi:hypothetical protein